MVSKQGKYAKSASNRGVGSYVVENREIIQEIRSVVGEKIKEEFEEVKKILNKKNNLDQPEQVKVDQGAKMIDLEVQKDKLVARLDDNRELSIPIAWFAKWGVKGVTSNKLKKYEIWEGDEIYFPEIDEVLGIEVFTKGFSAECE